MDLIETILVALLTSSAVSSGIVAIAKSWIESRLRLEHDRELTRLATNLRKESDERLARLRDELRQSTEQELARARAEQNRLSNEANELLQIRLRSFPKLAELVYRIRNAARELRDSERIGDRAVSEFRRMADDFEEALYEYRFPLEQASVFSEVHGYKNLLRAFTLNLKELALTGGADSDDAADNGSRTRLAAAYENIDRAHHGIVAELAVLVFSRTTS